MLEADAYDCVIFTQTLQFIDEPLVALNNLYAALKPGGSVLMTVPGIAQRDAYDDNLWGDYYRWMPRGLEHLMGKSMFETHRVEGFGNILATQAFIHNMAIEDLSADELAHRDRDYPLIVTCVATKALESETEAPARQAENECGDEEIGTPNILLAE